MKAPKHSIDTDAAVFVSFSFVIFLLIYIIINLYENDTPVWFLSQDKLSIGAKQSTNKERERTVKKQTTICIKQLQPHKNRTIKCSI